MNQVLENILTRRSVRRYKQKQISPAELKTILKAGSFAPSGNNMQSWRFTAVQNSRMLKKINETIRNSILQTPISDNTSEYMIRLREKATDENINYMFNAPTYVIVSNLRDNSNSMADSALAIGNMMLVAHSLGIGSCWVNLLSRITDLPLIRKMLSDLAIPENHKVYGAITLGYPDGIPREASPRKDVINIIE